MKKSAIFAIFKSAAMGSAFLVSIAQGGTYEQIKTCVKPEPLATSKVRGSALTGHMVGPTALAQFASVEEKILRPFKSDGCSSAPNGITTSDNRQVWVGCCVAHDSLYWKGGTFQEKMQADQQFESCVAQTGYPKIAAIYSATVKQFAGPNTHQSFRWGFGWNFKRGYGELSLAEKSQIEKMYGVSSQDVSAVLNHSTTQIFESCNTIDTAFTPLMKEEKVIYQHLNQNLKKDRLIQSSQVTDFNLNTKTIQVRLEGCAESVEYVFTRGIEQPVSVRETCF